MLTVQVLAAILAAAAVAGVLYAVIYLALRKRRSRPRWFMLLAEYILTGWAVLYLFVTQVMSFGNGIGDLLNLVPLQAFEIAWNYGLVNAGSLSQLGLNIVMTVPLGVLLPLVFPKRFDSFWRLLALGAGLTVATELVQFFTGRHADVDDVIANTVGVLVGYSAFVLVRALVVRRPPWAKPIVALAVIVAVALPFAAVAIKDAQDPFGHLYYGHLQPASVAVQGALPAGPSTGAVYRYVEQETRAQVIARLTGALGVSPACSEEQGTSTCVFGPSRLIVSPNNEWSVLYVYGDDGQGDAALVPPVQEAIADAKAAVDKLGIDGSTLRYVGTLDFGDNFAHLEFATEEHSGKHLLWGEVLVTIGENGAVRDIYNRQHSFEWVRNVALTTPQAALHQAQEFGIQKVRASADVSSVEPSFYFNPDTGYLIPTWQITGELHQTAGPTLLWTPAIDARAP